MYIGASYKVRSRFVLLPPPYQGEGYLRGQDLGVGICIMTSMTSFWHIGTDDEWISHSKSSPQIIPGYLHQNSKKSYDVLKKETLCWRQKGHNFSAYDGYHFVTPCGVHSADKNAKVRLLQALKHWTQLTKKSIFTDHRSQIKCHRSNVIC